MGIIHLARSQNFPKNNISYPLIRNCTYLKEPMDNITADWVSFFIFLLTKQPKNHTHTHTHTQTNTHTNKHTQTHTE